MISPYFDIIKRIGLVDFENCTAIDIGCGKNESDVARQILDMPFKKLVSVEGYKPDYEIMKAKRFAAHQHETRLMRAEDIDTNEVFDIAFTFDVLEHLTKENGEKLLDKLDIIAKKSIIFVPMEPEGFHRKVSDDNALQEHISYWNEQDFLKRGYRVERIENCHSEQTPEGDTIRFPALWCIKEKEVRKYSIIIPIWDIEGKLGDMIHACIESVKKCSEKKDYEIVEVWNVKGFPKAVNQGLERAIGEYIIVLNDDVIVNDDAWLEKLESDSISSWRMHPFFITGKSVPDGSCWCMPRKVYEKLGKLDEQFSEGYGFEDSDYWMRAEQAGIPFKDAKVNLTHRENKTFQTYYAQEKEAMTAKNEVLFRTKWQKYLS